MSIDQHPAAAEIALETRLKEAGARRSIGKSINRVEDPRFLRGEGRYLDDIVLPHMTHAAILRSPHAHARIVSIDASRAEALPGVVRVVTGADVTEHAAPLPSFGAGGIIQHMIAVHKVRHYGEAVAVVVAEDRYIAEDACDLIDVVYEPLPAVLDPFAASDEDARRSCTTRWARTSPTSGRSRSATSTGRSSAPRARCRRGCAGRGRPRCPWTRTARSATTTAARAS